ncbi:MAG: translation initiation factor IF-3 [Planctomycetota bacterium]|nr:translation initiation factor IF-3 [Planctomycetota bacterium]MDA1105284.1 translation initiation factor IF-3 [Planctomycetota bacterium]
MNDRIRITPIRLIDQTGEMVGIVETDEARRQAYEAGLDLVEIAPDVRPPVCKIMDYGKHKYETSKQERANRAKSKTQELKEVRLGRSMKIDPHDIGIRIRQARGFLLEGHKVLIVQNFRGREMQFQSKGLERMQNVATQLSDLAKVELVPRLNGRRLNMIMAPDKSKVDQYKRRESKAAEAAIAASRAVTENPEPDHDDDDDHVEHDNQGVEVLTDLTDAGPDGATGDAGADGQS